MKNERSAIVMLAVGVFLGCLVFINGESVWGFLKGIFLGMFGWVAVLWAVLFCWLAIYVFVKRYDKKLFGKIMLGSSGIMLLSTAMYIFKRAYLENQLKYFETLKDLYARGNARENVGVASGLLGYPMAELFDDGGAKVVILLLCFVFVALVFGRSIYAFINTMVKNKKRADDENRSNPRDRKHRNVNEEANFYRDDRKIDIELEPGEKRKGYKREDSVLPFAQEAAIIKDVSDKDKLERLNRAFGIANNEEEYEKESYEDCSDYSSEEIDETGSGIPKIKSETSIKDIIGQQEKNKKKLKEDIKDEVAAIKTSMYEKSISSDGEYHFPPITLLEGTKKLDASLEADEQSVNGKLLVNTLKSFGIEARILEISRGPAVTRYELQPAPGVKISKITNLSDDIAMNLAASGVRIEAPIPGKAAIGIEVPNKNKVVIRMRDVVESNSFVTAKSKLTVALGRDIAGEAVVADLSKMPHLLIAGTTGSGKSVCINSFIISLIYKASPEDVKLLMIDPKVVELRIYNGIPHLMVPVVTDPRKAAGALNWAVGEMMNRYRTFAENNVRDLASYNKLCAGKKDEEGNIIKKMPQIVILIDELADLMMAAPNEVEDSICRLAQLARAAGMHLVVATQRPSVDVITGLIKANIPSRIAFTVASPVDSRVILDAVGADKLLGYGDMLFAPVNSMKPMRVQGCYISDEEIEAVIDFVKKTKESEYDENVINEIEKSAAAEKKEEQNDDDDGISADPMMDEAIKCVVEAGQASTSLLQRRLRLGYARAGRLIDQMEQAGIVGPYEGSKPRQVLITYQQWLEMSVRKRDEENS